MNFFNDDKYDHICILLKFDSDITFELEFNFWCNYEDLKNMKYHLANISKTNY